MKQCFMKVYPRMPSFNTLIQASSGNKAEIHLADLCLEDMVF